MLADVGALALPIVPAFSGIVRAGKMVDKAMDAGRAVDRGEDFSGFFRWMDRQADIADEMITVRHYTDYEGMLNVLKSDGQLRAGAWVTLPSEIPHGMGKAGIRRVMAVDDKLALPRTGDFFIDVQVKRSALVIDAVQGPTAVSKYGHLGGGLQWRLAHPISVSDSHFLPWRAW